MTPAPPSALSRRHVYPIRTHITNSQQIPVASSCLYTFVRIRRLLYQKRSDTVGEITTRRQKPLVLRIMVEQGSTRILFLSGLTPRCEQIFPHRCCFQPVRRFRQRCPTVFVTLNSSISHLPSSKKSGSGHI